MTMREKVVFGLLAFVVGACGGWIGSTLSGSLAKEGMVEVQVVSLYDKYGRERGGLAVGDDGTTVMTLKPGESDKTMVMGISPDDGFNLTYMSKGKSRFSLSASDLAEPQILMKNGKGDASISLGILDDFNGLLLQTKHGEASIAIHGEAGPAIVLKDKSGNVVYKAP